MGDARSAWTAPRVGLYRAVCTNGLVVSAGTFPVFDVAHRGDVVADVVQGALEISERFQTLAASVERMERTRLDQLQRLDFAAEALVLRFRGSTTSGVQARPIAFSPMPQRGTGNGRRSLLNLVCDCPETVRARCLARADINITTS